MFASILIFYALLTISYSDLTTEEVQYLNELPIDKLIKLKNSLKQLVTPVYDNMTEPSSDYIHNFGAQAMAVRAPLIKRKDEEESLYKKDSYSKVSNIFSMSVTTLAFLAFGGYLLCLIVQAVKAKQNYNNNAVANPVQPTTFFVSSGIKKRPQTHFASYGRRRNRREVEQLQKIELSPEDMFSALLLFCEGYAKWSGKIDNYKTFNN